MVLSEARHASALTTISDLRTDEIRVLELLATHTYQEVALRTGLSHGAIYRIALRHGARKTEERIRRRSAERIALQRAAFEAMLDTTVTADVLDFAESIPDGSLDLIVTSVPYNIGKRYDGAASADQMRHVYYHGWLMQIVSEMARTLKAGGTVVAQVGATKDDDGSIVPLDVMLFDDFRRAGLTYQNRVVWPTHHGLTPSKRLAERYETALIFSRGEPTFNANAARTPQRNPGKRAFRGPNKGRLSGHPLGAHPSDVWQITHLGNNHGEKTEHPAQFPVAFPKRAIMLYTNPGDIVSDWFNGSGSTQVAAIESGRQFIGADIFYQDVRNARVAAAEPDRVTPLSGVSAESMAIWQAEARRIDAYPQSVPDAAADAVMLLDIFGEQCA